MAKKLNSFERFWQELKRRKVVHVTTVYAAIAMGIIQLVDIIGPSLQWPAWTITFIIVLLCIGFIISVFVAWVYDITPSGVKKTRPVSAVRQADQPITPTSGGWKIAAYVSALIIVAVISFNFFNKRKSNADILKPDKSIAVLPFANLSNDPEQEYFSDGIVEAILDNLLKVGELKVTSGTSTKRYKNLELSIKQIGKELGVASVLEGSVQKAGNKVRIIAQLINARTDETLWSETYDRNISDIFSIQSEVARNVARELKATLTSEEKEKIERNPTSNTEAYNLYLQGRFFWHKRTEEALKKSVEYFQMSIEADPKFALALAGLADSYYINSLYEWMPQPEGFSKAKELAYKALELDKDLAEAHTTLGNILFWNDWNWEEARKELAYAIELNPNYSIGYMSYTELLDIINETDEAISQINFAIEKDPLVSLLHAASGIFYYNVGKNKESLDECEKTTDINPDYFRYSSRLFFLNYVRLGEGLKAVDVLQKAMPDDKETLKEAYRRSGTNGLLNFLIESELKKTEPSPMNLARWCSLLGRKNEALGWLEKAFDDRYNRYMNFTQMPRINSNPDFDNIRSEPRFMEIINRMGLSGYQKVKQ